MAAEHLIKKNLRIATEFKFNIMNTNERCSATTATPNWFHHCTLKIKPDVQTQLYKENFKNKLGFTDRDLTHFQKKQIT